MDARLFDRLTASLAGTESRRRLLVLLMILPLGERLRGFLGGEAADAAQPARRVQHRAAKRRQRARHRLQHRRAIRRRNNGHGRGGGSAGGTCVPLDQVCSSFGDPCCQDTFCRPTAAVVIATCQHRCVSTGECQRLFGVDTSCVHDDVACPGLEGCCRPNECTSQSICHGGGPCCPTLTGPSRCCAEGQRCARGGGCQNP